MAAAAVCHSIIQPKRSGAGRGAAATNVKSGDIIDRPGNDLDSVPCSTVFIAIRPEPFIGVRRMLTVE